MPKGIHADCPKNVLDPLSLTQLRLSDMVAAESVCSVTNRVTCRPHVVDTKPSIGVAGHLTYNPVAVEGSH